MNQNQRKFKLTKQSVKWLYFGTVRPLLSLWHELPLYPENRRGHEEEREENQGKKVNRNKSSTAKYTLCDGQM